MYVLTALAFVVAAFWLAIAIPPLVMLCRRQRATLEGVRK